MNNDREVCNACMEKRFEESNKLAKELHELKKRVAAFLRAADYTDDDIMTVLDVDREQLKMIEHTGTYPWGKN